MIKYDPCSKCLILFCINLCCIFMSYCSYFNSLKICYLCVHILILISDMKFRYFDFWLSQLKYSFNRIIIMQNLNIFTSHFTFEYSNFATVLSVYSILNILIIFMKFAWMCYRYLNIWAFRNQLYYAAIITHHHMFSLCHINVQWTSLPVNSLA